MTDRHGHDIREAFFNVISDPTPNDRCFVSLYIIHPFYGGPEEGGWWGEDWELVCYQQYANRELATFARDRVKEDAKLWNKEERDKYGDRCLKESHWLDARGLDDDYLPEVDGESRYIACIEDRPGNSEQRGNRQWE